MTRPLLTLAIFCALSGPLFSADKPNIVLIMADDMGFSPYGNQANAEDQAEFARLYAYCIDAAVGTDMKGALKKLSPERFELWEHMLHKSKALPISDSDADQRKRAVLSDEMKPKLAQVRENIRKLTTTGKALQ